MAYWKSKNASMKVLKRKTVNTPMPRKKATRNLTDKEAKREGRTSRVKGWVNTTDGAKRKSHRRETPSRTRANNFVNHMVGGSLNAIPQILSPRSKRK